MEEPNQSNVVKAKETTNGVINKSICLSWDVNITVIDLSNRKINNLDDNIKFPANLVNLDVSHNCLVQIPNCVLEINNLKILDLSFNKIKYFDDIPSFIESIESLNLESNELEGPPYWVWSESPAKLSEMNLSNNVMISKSLDDDYFEELLQYKCLVINLKLSRCALHSHIQLLQCFPNVKVLDLGTPDCRLLTSNKIPQVPCKGLDSCCDIERLNLCNTQLFAIENNIDMYKKLIEIDLSHNDLVGVPDQFCKLDCLEICILSHNRILYLPEDFVNLKKLCRLHLDSNELCMLPKDIGLLPNLKVLDVYDNRLHELADDVKNISELDLALNFFEEPTDEEYLLRKERLRMNISNRSDGRKLETPERSECYSSSTTDDEELIKYLDNIGNVPEQSQPVNPPSSPEDWDSDDYWMPVPHFCFDTPRPKDAWMSFVRTKMAEGAFCPMDIHPVSVAEQVHYEQMCNPKVWREVRGQFDDCSEEES